MRKLCSSFNCGLVAGLLCLTPHSWGVENTLAEYERCALNELRDGVDSVEAIKKFCSREYAAYSETLPDEYRESDLRRLDSMLGKILKNRKRREG
jgi:hypothetical protein